MLRFLGKIEPQRPLACRTPQVNPHPIMKAPPSCRMLNPLPLEVETRRFTVFERLAEPIPVGVLTSKAILRQFPAMIAAAEILPENLPDA